MDAIVTLDNFKLMVCALIKFLNQLSERDKAAAIKFLIATLKNSTKEQFKYWSEDDRSVWFDSTRIFDRKTSTTTTTTTTTTAAAVTAVSGNFELHKTQSVCDTDDNDECNRIIKWPTSNDDVDDTRLSICLENIKSEGNFNTKALVPFEEKKPYHSAHWHNSRRFCDGTSFGRDIKVLFDLGHRECDLLKIFFNRFIFDQSDDDRSLVRVHTQIDHLKSEAKLTEIKEEDGGGGSGDDDIDRIMDTDDIEGVTDETTQKSSEESLPETSDRNDADASQNKSPRKRKLYKCFQCPKFYLKRKTLAVHYKFHPGFCYDCGQPNGSTIEERVQHNRVNHSKQYPYVCGKCGDSMSRNQQYLSHMKTHDKEPVFRSECLRCGDKFTNAKAYKDHLHEMGHMDGARVCEYCGKSFADGAMLHQHIKRIHQSSKAHPCEHCNKSFDNRSNLLRHMHLHKNQGTNFVCSQCNASYTTMNALKDHINDKHTKKKIHVCEICNKEFTNGHLYRNHVVTHSEDRPFACTICSKAFKLKTNLVRHTKRCHAVEEKKDGSGAVSGVKRPSSEKDESSADMSPTPPPPKKPFQPFSSESSFFKNNIPSVHFQSSSSTQSPSSISNEADLLSKEPNPVIETKMQQFQHQPATVPMQETFTNARDTFASGAVTFPNAAQNITPTQLPSNSNQGPYMPYAEQFQQHMVKSANLHQPKSHQKARAAAHNQRPPPQQQPTPHMHSIAATPPHGHGIPASAQQRHNMSAATLQRHGMHNQMMQSGMHQQQQHQQQFSRQQFAQSPEASYQYQSPPPQSPANHPHPHPHQRQPYMHQRNMQTAQANHQQHFPTQPQYQHQPQHQHPHQQPHPQQHVANQQVYPSRPPTQQKSRVKYDYTNYQQHQNSQQLQPQHPHQHQHSQSQHQHSQAQTALPIAKHDQTNVSPYAYASNPAPSSSTFNAESNAWNQMTPTLVETSSGQYMPIDQVEMSKYNRSMPATDNKMSFPYQNMWPNEQTNKLDFETNNLETATKQEQQQLAAQQQHPQQHPQQQHQQQHQTNTSGGAAVANTYNNIGNILTNLELLGNNSNFDPGNYEVISSSYAQMPAANGGETSYYNIQGSHGQQHQSPQQQHQPQHAYNNRVPHTVTDIPNTILPEAQQNNMSAMQQSHHHPQDTTNSWMQQTANHQGQQHINDVTGALTADTRTMDEFKSPDNSFMELNNASGNVLLPSLADYLYHPLGTGASIQDNVPVPNNSNNI